MTDRTSFPLDRGAPPVDVVPAPLPTSAYSDHGQLEREMASLWAPDWIFVGPRHRFPSERGYTPLTVAGKPVLVTVEDGQLRAFYNVCAHRGCKLVAAAVIDRSTVSCPYHAWVYGLDGKLRSARDFAGSGSNHVPPSGIRITGLRPIGVAVWLDFVFVNVSDEAPPLEICLMPVTQRWSGVDLTSLTHYATATYDFRANWKLIVENFLESYHVPFLHRTLDTYSPATGRYQVQLANHINGIGTRPYEGVTVQGRPLPTWPHRKEEALDYAEYFNATPNFLLGIMPDHLFAWSLEPVSPERTIEELHFYFPRQEATDPELEEHRRITVDRWRQVNDEDHDIVQRMHSGLRSSAFARAHLSPVMERNLFRFQTRVLEETSAH